MTPEEILRDLRDIHLPQQATDAAGAGIVLWPAAIVIVLALLAFWLSWRRRSVWRRDIVEQLNAIERDVGDGRIREAWTALATLLRRIAVQLCGRQEVAGLIDEAWLEKLDQLFRTRAFSSGPGRGVILFPYGAPEDDVPEASQSMADQLSAILADVRLQLPKLRAAR